MALQGRVHGTVGGGGKGRDASAKGIEKALFKKLSEIQKNTSVLSTDAKARKKSEDRQIAIEKEQNKATHGVGVKQLEMLQSMFGSETNRKKLEEKWEKDGDERAKAILDELTQSNVDLGKELSQTFMREGKLDNKQQSLLNEKLEILSQNSKSLGIIFEVNLSTQAQYLNDILDDQSVDTKEKRKEFKQFVQQLRENKDLMTDDMKNQHGSLEELDEHLVTLIDRADKDNFDENSPVIEAFKPLTKEMITSNVILSKTSEQMGRVTENSFKTAFEVSLLGDILKDLGSEMWEVSQKGYLDFFLPGMGNLSKQLSVVWNDLKGLFNALKATFKFLGKMMGGLLKGMGGLIKKGFGKMMGAFEKYFPKMTAMLKKGFKGMWKGLLKVWPFLAGLWSMISTPLMLLGLGAIIFGAAYWLGGKLREWFPSIDEFTQAIFEGIGKIVQWFEDLWQKMPEWIGGGGGKETDEDKQKREGNEHRDSKRVENLKNNFSSATEEKSQRKASFAIRNYDKRLKAGEEVPNITKKQLEETRALARGEGATPAGGTDKHLASTGISGLKPKALPRVDTDPPKKDARQGSGPGGGPIVSPAVGGSSPKQSGRMPQIPNDMSLSMLNLGYAD